MKNIIQKMLILGIIFIVSSILIVNIAKSYQEKTFPKAYEIQIQKISNLLDDLVVLQDVKDFSETIMYTDVQPQDYSESSGKFLQDYVGVKKYCADSAQDCFASKYYNENKKTLYNPDFTGSCAILKNKMSICITPQTGNNDIVGFIDVNGLQGPNVLDKDLRKFTIEAKKVSKKTMRKSSQVIIFDENMNY